MRKWTLVLATLWAVAADARVYRWVDAGGEVHFGDHLPARVEAERVRLPPPPKVDPKAAMKAIEEDHRRGVEEYLKARDEARSKHAAAVAKQARRQASCDTARANLSKLEGLGNRLVQMPDGSFVRLTEEDRQARMTEARTQIKKYCK